MNVLSLTHAHLHPDGLSPVSCERADSLAGTWGKDLHWNVDVVCTTGTKWRGIWPDGKGMAVNILYRQAPPVLMMQKTQLFSAEVRELYAKKKVGGLLALAMKRISKRIRQSLSGNGLALPMELVKARQWGQILADTETIKTKKYDFLFACVGYGDEYLLETALVIAQKLDIPMVVDFRDLWSDHHNAGRFTDKQRKLICALEQRLLAKTVLVSVPQKHMVTLLKKWLKTPVYLLSHSAYKDPSWADGHATDDIFTMLYAGKLYADGPGLGMMMDLLKKLSAAKLYRPFKCRFFVDDTDTLTKTAAAYGVSEHIEANGWVSPGELWQQMRSANLLLIPDSGVAENYPLLPTKTFQYAYTGRQILCLSPYKIDELQGFLDSHHAGKVYTNTDDAAEWVAALSFDKGQYEKLPPLRDIPQREQAAYNFGIAIEKVLQQQ